MRSWAVAVLAVGVAGTVGCDRLGATVQAVSILTRTPDLEDATSWDSQLTGIIPTDDSDLNVTGVVAALGERAGGITDTEPPTPIAGATISVSWSGKQVRLCDVGEPGSEGTYQANSLPDAANCGDITLTYDVGATYTTEIETSTDVYTTNVKAPDAIDATKVDFAPALGAVADAYGADLQHHALNSGLEVSWERDSAAASRNTIVTLLRVKFDPIDEDDANAALEESSWTLDPQNPIFDNAPRQPDEFISLVTQTPPTSLSIPATAFSQRGLYLLVLTNAELSTDTSSNLQLGSGALAGFGTPFVFFVD